MVLQIKRFSRRQRLKQHLTALVNEYLSLPFSPNPDILHLPVSLHGFGFPSIVRTNAAVAVAGLRRDLNHPNPLFSDLARIVLSNWSVHFHNFLYPLSHPASQYSSLSYHRHLPAAYIVAQSTLHAINVAIVPTDQSFLWSGDISLLALPTTHLTPSTQTLSMYVRRGRGRLSDWGLWLVPPHSSRASFQPSTLNPFAPRSAPSEHFPLVKAWLSDISLCDIVIGDLSLAYPRNHRRRSAVAKILAADGVFSLFRGSYNLRDTDGRTLWATDGLHIPGSSTSSSAVVGPSSLAFTLHGTASQSLQAEVFALIVAFVLAERKNLPNSLVLSDHAASVHLVEDARATGLAPHFWTNKNAQSYYRWLSDIATTSSCSTALHHVKAHTTSTTVPSQLNHIADRTAAEARQFPAFTPSAPVPTFSMDDFTLWSHTHGYIESDDMSFVDDELSRISANHVAIKSIRMARDIHDSRPTPAYAYVQAFSAYSALVQIQTRSGQLPVASTLYRRKMASSPACQLRCGWLWEDVHHVFVSCPHTTHLRAAASASVRAEVAAAIIGAPADVRENLLNATEHLFRDDPIWPLEVSKYYLGHTPSVHGFLDTELEWDSSLTRARIGARVHSTWHSSSIRLAGRIWGFHRRFIH